MLRLHLGCGKRHAKGFVNIDIQQYGDAVDVICDITKDIPFKNETVDLIYSCGVLEHFDRGTWRSTLEYWKRLLKPGGKIQLSTVDFDAIVARYKEKRNIEELVGLLLGGSKNDSFHDRHGIMFNLDYLKEEMEKIGYSNIERCDWKEFEPYILDDKYDDFSRAYLPFMDFENGRLMVLNIRGEK